MSYWINTGVVKRSEAAKAIEEASVQGAPPDEDDDLYSRFETQFAEAREAAAASVEAVDHDRVVVEITGRVNGDDIVVPVEHVSIRVSAAIVDEGV